MALDWKSIEVAESPKRADVKPNRTKRPRKAKIQDPVPDGAVVLPTFDECARYLYMDQATYRGWEKRGLFPTPPVTKDDLRRIAMRVLIDRSRSSVTPEEFERKQRQIDERTRLLEAQTREKELRAAAQLGELVPRAKFMLAAAKVINQAKQLLLTLPIRLRRDMAIEDDPEKVEAILREEISRALEALSADEILAGKTLQ